MHMRGEVEQALRMLGEPGLFAACFEDFCAAHPVPEAEIKRMYDTLCQADSGRQLRLRVLNVATSDEAKCALRRLREGANFAQLARQCSGEMGPPEGLLDWLSEDALPDNLRYAIEALGRGQYTMPARVHNGYAILYIEDARATPVEPLDQIRDLVVTLLQVERFDEHLRALAKLAKPVATNAAGSSSTTREARHQESGGGGLKSRQRPAWSSFGTISAPKTRE
jgi:peptidyl-prolyl cis-trans isomerase C